MWGSAADPCCSRPAPAYVGRMRAPARARLGPAAAASAPREKRKRKNMGAGPVRPGEDDALLHQIAAELNPVEAVSLVQWYPGHIAKAERDLREQLSAVDMILEVRDGRCPMSTRHPALPKWAGTKPRLLLLNRADMVHPKDAAAWSKFFAERGRPATWTTGSMGEGVPVVVKQAAQLGARLNERRAARGLRPRAVRAVVVGFPNVGKSALINRLLGRRVAESAPKPGVTRALRWARVAGADLDLLDAPGIIPMSLKNQAAAARLAMCNDIGEAAYVPSLIAAELLKTLGGLPGGGAAVRRVEERYRLPADGLTAEEYVHAVAERSFNGEPDRAGVKILVDFRQLALGKVCLELPDQYQDWASDV